MTQDRQDKADLFYALWLLMEQIEEDVPKQWTKDLVTAMKDAKDVLDNVSRHEDPDWIMGSSS